ncbi:MAG: hypothetical protein ACFB22_10340 [Rhodothalassiaceae bacterium]
MTRARSLRPAWRGMGVWKWPSLVLVLFCLAVVPIYIDRIDRGRPNFGTWTASGLLAGCPVEVGGRALKDALFVRVRVDASCSRHLADLTVQAGQARAALHGNPNTLRARLTTRPPAVTEIALSARGTDGRPVEIRWTPEFP